MVEFALVLPLAILLVLGGFDTCRLLWTKLSVTELAREGSRFASVRGSTSASPGPSPSDTASATVDYVTQLGSGIQNLQVNVTWTPTGSNTPGSAVTVSVAHTFQWFFVPVSPTALSSRSSMMIAY
jgi:Flp pilus assembly protein TadG